MEYVSIIGNGINVYHVAVYIFVNIIRERTNVKTVVDLLCANIEEGGIDVRTVEVLDLVSIKMIVGSVKTVNKNHIRMI